MTRRGAVAVLLAVSLAAAGCFHATGEKELRAARRPVIQLPAPRLNSGTSLEQALAHRQSVRQFATRPLTLTQIGQLLWAAQGVTRDGRGRTAPSAGALYPLEVYVAVPGRVLHYLPAGHRAEVWSDTDLRARLGSAAGQASVTDAPVVFVVTAVPARTAVKYGGRAGRYVDLEAGHAAENLLLQAVALGLGAVPVGAFDDRGVARALRLPTGESPRYLIPVGVPAVTPAG